jgi:exodeoxyribonuclease-3
VQIATWNVNSIRTRLDIVTQWLESSPVEILCLQETKVIDELFPRDSLESLGYSAYVIGQKSYNGVAILSKIPALSIYMGFGSLLSADLVGDLDEQKRTFAIELPDLLVVNVYVPNGSSLGSDKYVYKLHWLSVLEQYLRVALTKFSRVCICGDFNIAFEDRDIYKPKNKEIMCSPEERSALRSTIFDLGFQDAFRFFQPDGGYYSWWDYRHGGFASNRGWRIDCIFLSADLISLAKDCTIDVEPRKLVQPSDHTPVIVTLG